MTILEWHRIGDYAQRSEPGDYRISKSGPREARIFTAWRPGRWYAFDHTPIGYFPTAQLARDCCQSHANAASHVQGAA